MSLLSGLTLRVESTVLPPFDVDLSPGGSGSETSALGRAFKPKVTLLKGGSVIAQEAPYGDPTDAYRRVWIAGAVALFLVLLLITRRLA